MCDQTTNTTGQIQGGEVKAYAVTSEERHRRASPTSRPPSEGGLPEVQVGIWHGLYVPAGTPEDVIATLSEALQAALLDEDVIARFAELGNRPVAAEQATPAAHAAYLGEQIELWRRSSRRPA